MLSWIYCREIDAFKQHIIVLIIKSTLNVNICIKAVNFSQIFYQKVRLVSSHPDQTDIRAWNSINRISCFFLFQVVADFNGHRGPGSVEVAGKRIVKYALIDKDGPTGKFFSEENNPETGEVPW